MPTGELIPIVVGFDYELLEAKVAERVRAGADRIRDRVKKTVGTIITVGNELLTVKKILGHGHFCQWLGAEFGWSLRTAHNFMSVAERFQSATFANLPIQPSAAYLLAASSVPDEARMVAVAKAESGEMITFAIAKAIVAAVKKKRPRKPLSAKKLGPRLAKMLERYKERWSADELSELARRLRTFADDVENPEESVHGKMKRTKE